MTNSFKKFKDRDIITLGVDIDGVLNDFIQGFNDLYHIHFPDKVIYDNQEWYFYKKLDFDDQDPREWFIKTKGEVFKYSKPFPNIVNAMAKILNYCKDNDIRLCIITSQPNKVAMNGAIGWLEKHNIKYDDIIFCKSKYKLSKCDIMVDDSEKVLKFKPDNKVSIKVNRKWNEGVDSDFSVDSVSELTEDFLDNVVNLLKKRR